MKLNIDENRAKSWLTSGSDVFGGWVGYFVIGAVMMLVGFFVYRNEKKEEEASVVTPEVIQDIEHEEVQNDYK